MALIPGEFGGRDTIDWAVQPLGRRASLRPVGLEPAAAGAAFLPAASPPLNRRRRSRSRLSPAALGSGILHGLILALLLVTRPSLQKGTQEPPSIEMVFGHNGGAGLAGSSVPQAEQGAPPEIAPAPEPLAPPPTPPTSQPAPAAPPITARSVPTRPQAASKALERAERAPPRPREAHPARPSSNPFANLTDLSLAPAQTGHMPEIARRGRGGSGRAVSLSVGPMVQGGKLAMPFSIRGGHGLTSDYRELLDEWVEARKYYPQSAAERGHDGQVAIHVVWDRDGHVLSVSLIYGSGDDDLDDAWLGLFRGARLPPPPPDVPGNPIEYDMIMNYELIH